MIFVRLQGKPFSITVIQVYALTSNTEEAEVEWFYEDWIHICLKAFLRVFHFLKYLKHFILLPAVYENFGLFTSSRTLRMVSLFNFIHYNRCVFNTEEAEVEWFYENTQKLLELTFQKRCPFHYMGLKCKSRKSRNTWSKAKLALKYSIIGRGIDLDYCDIEWFSLETNENHSVIFETASKYWILDSFVDCDGYSISSKGLELTQDILKRRILFHNTWK